MDIIKRKFGIEFEFSSDFDILKDVVKQVINRIYGYKKFYAKKGVFKSIQEEKWTLKEDHSTNCELTTPVSLPSDIKKIIKVVKLLKESKKCKITDRDSIHIHIAANNVLADNLIAAWLQIEHIIIKCFPKHRIHNTWCPTLIEKKLKKENIASLFENAKGIASQHHAIMSTNPMSSTKHTVEFRISEGTLDYKFIMAWLDICMNFVEYAKKIKLSEVLCQKPGQIKTLEEMFNLLKIKNTNTIKIFMKRYKKYK